MWLKTKQNKVGHSERTLGKHVLLNRILGREIGVYVNRIQELPRKHCVIDACAGDGLPTPHSKTSSPAIIQKHAEWAAKKKLFVKTIFIEKDQYTFIELKNNVKKGKCICENAFVFDSAEELLGLEQPYEGTLFIHADPNDVNDWPLSNNFIATSPKYTTFLITMGCNVGGLKRLSFDKRALWFDRMDNLIQSIAGWHNIILISLNGDLSQWAYLIVGPMVWTDKYINDANAAFSYWENGVTIIDYKRDRDSFIYERDRLFMTAKERDRKYAA